MVVSTMEPAAQESDMLSPEALQYAPLEAKLNEWGLPFTIDRDFPIDQITTDLMSQVRLPTHLNPTTRVDEYTMQMRNGAVFPPILLRVPGNVLIDGNTRIAAAKRVGRKTICALLVDTKTEAMHLILAAAVNQMGGERLTAQEAHQAALLMVKAGYPDVSIARELGRDQSQVRRWRAQQDVMERGERLGLGNLEEKVNRSVAGALGDIRLEAPFIEAARLFVDIRPNEKEGRAIVAAVVQAPSEEAALTIIRGKREEMAPAGPPPGARTRDPQYARMAIGNLVKLEGRPTTAFDPSKRDEELARWERLSKVVDEVLRAIRATPSEVTVV